MSRSINSKLSSKPAPTLSLPTEVDPDKERPITFTSKPKKLHIRLEEDPSEQPIL